MTKRGKLITVSGIDGSGKTSVLDFLKGVLGSGYVFTREPGGTPNGLRIRDIVLNQGEDKLGPMVEMYLFIADRLHHIETVIEPALAMGHNVVSDRFNPDTYAYQVAGREASEKVRETFFNIHAPILKEIGPENIHYLLLDLDPEVARERMVAKGKSLDTIESRGPDFQKRVRQGFLDFLRANHHGITFDIVDANQPLEVVLDKVFELVRKVTS